MTAVYRFQKLRDLAYACWLLQTTLSPRITRNADNLAIQRERRLRALLRWAKDRSPFYRKTLRAVDVERAPVQDLPILTKREMMGQYDELVTDPRLRLDSLRRHLEQMTHDTYYRYGFKVFLSGGSSGNPTVMAYHWKEFAVVLAQILRVSRKAVPSMGRRRLRGANVYARTPTHDSIRISQSFQVGFHRVLDLYVDTPIEELVRQLNQFRPDVLSGYPSSITELAHAQEEMRLRISPKAVFLGSEPVTPIMRQQIRRGFGIEPHDHYGTTEAIVMACECPLHLGMHLNDDVHWIEIVDKNNRPVGPGETGHKVLVTNLFAYAQPIIRYELSDILVLDADSGGPCPCGSSMRRIRRVLGRNEDILNFASSEGKVSVGHEDIRALMETIPNIRQFQVIQNEKATEVRVAVKDPANADTTLRQTESGFKKFLADLNATATPIEIKIVADLERSSAASQKFRQIWNRST